MGQSKLFRWVIRIERQTGTPTSVIRVLSNTMTYFRLLRSYKFDNLMFTIALLEACQRSQNGYTLYAYFAGCCFEQVCVNNLLHITLKLIYVGYTSVYIYIYIPCLVLICILCAKCAAQSELSPRIFFYFKLYHDWLTTRRAVRRFVVVIEWQYHGTFVWQFRIDPEFLMRNNIYYSTSHSL
jgi:hypothetical protein